MTRALSEPAPVSGLAPRPRSSSAPQEWRGVLGLPAERARRTREGRLRPARARQGPAELLDLRRALADRLVARARDGERISVTEKRGLTLGDLLRVQRAEREVLHSMSARERHRAYRERRLSSYQLSVWWGAYPREIPRIDGHPEWIAVTLVDVCEHPEYRARLPRAQ
jgi:hypothetical protein